MDAYRFSVTNATEHKTASQSPQFDKKMSSCHILSVFSSCWFLLLSRFSFLLLHYYNYYVFVN